MRDYSADDEGSQGFKREAWPGVFGGKILILCSRSSSTDEKKKVLVQVVGEREEEPKPASNHQHESLAT